MAVTVRNLPTVLLIVLAAAAPAAGEVPSVAPEDVPPGTRGVCRTEMDGGEMVDVPVTVLGRLAGTAPEGELVLVRLEGPRFEHAGIIAGMSGSPVYVEDKLLGALAFGWPFAKDPIGGVTPFDRMLEIGSGAGDGAPGAAARRPSLGVLLDSLAAGDLGTVLVDWLAPEEANDRRALPLAVSTGGLGLPAGWLAEAWERLGWVASAATAVDPVPVQGPLVPGAMVAGLLATGDASLSVGGTVTEVRGDNVWAFGHPFLGGGSLPMPMARARVVAVLPNLMSSFKFYSVGEAVGGFRVDRTHGVWGRLGQSIPMVPLEVEADGRVYRFRCIRHPVLFPLIAGYLTQGSLLARGRQFGDQTVMVRVEGELEGGATATMEQSFAAPDSPALAAGSVTMLLAYLEGSAVELPPLAGARVRVSSREKIEQAEIVEAVPDRRVVRPGERLGIRVRLRSWRGEESVERVEIQVPGDVPRGRLDAIVADGGSWTQYDLKMRPQSPRTASDELSLLARVEPSHRLVVALERADPGVALPGGPVSTPPSIELALRSGLGVALAPITHRVIARADRTMAVVLLGGHRLPLVVRYDGIDAEEEAPASPEGAQ